MSMDKRWTELFTRLEAVEKELRELKAAVNKSEPKKETVVKKTGSK